MEQLFWNKSSRRAPTIPGARMYGKERRRIVTLSFTPWTRHQSVSEVSIMVLRNIICSYEASPNALTTTSKTQFAEIEFFLHVLAVVDCPMSMSWTIIAVITLCEIADNNFISVVGCPVPTLSDDKNRQTHQM